MSGLFRPRFKDHKTGKTKKCRLWYAFWYDRTLNKTIRKPLKTEDKAIAQELLAKMLQEMRLALSGLPVDRHAPHRARPIEEHLEDFRKDQESRLTCKQVATVNMRCKTIIELADMKTIADLQPDRVRVALAQIKVAVQTKNHWIAAIKAFGHWLDETDRAEYFTLASLKKQNAELDRRLIRRALITEEIKKLLTAALTGEPKEGLTGLDRKVLYTVAILTGLRASELGSLTDDSFNLTDKTVTVQAGHSKHRRTDVLPLHASLVVVMQNWLHLRTGRLWPGAWPIHAARMLRFDLKAAGVDFKTSEGVADFHSLRHTFVSRLVRQMPPKVAQKLARHSDCKLTLDLYAHLERGELERALDGLPPLE